MQKVYNHPRPITNRSLVLKNTKIYNMRSILRVPLLLCCLFLLASTSQGQDMHFTNYAMTPSFFNPALAGNFSGTVRAGLAFRTQHEFIPSSVAATPFRTIGISVDAPLIFGFKKTHWLGVGLSILQDQVGISNPNTGTNPGIGDGLSQSWGRFVPGVSYNIGLDKKFRQVVSIGVQYGLTNVNYTGTDFEQELDILGQPNPDRDRFNSLDGISANYGSINVGVTYKSLISKTAEMELGAAVMHLQNPTFSLPMGQNATVYRRINIHGRYRVQSSKQLALEPSLFASFQGAQNNIQAQMRSEYKLKPKSDIALIAGLGYRLSDAVQLLTGARYKDWLISLSYDYALTAASDISPHKIELGASRIFTVNKRPKVDPTLYCPRM